MRNDEITMPNIAEWEYCSLKSERKVRGMACLYDADLYWQSDKALGFDLCIGTVAEQHPTTLWGIENSNAAFNGGVYVLEDNFDTWRNRSEPASARMNSAHWRGVVNAQANKRCGTASGEGALTFSGMTTRRIDTVPLDLRYGGTVQFALKARASQHFSRCVADSCGRARAQYAPHIDYGGTEKCVYAAGADVELQYNTGDGLGWRTIEVFMTIFYRNT